MFEIINILIKRIQRSFQERPTVCEHIVTRLHCKNIVCENDCIHYPMDAYDKIAMKSVNKRECPKHYIYGHDLGYNKDACTIKTRDNK